MTASVPPVSWFLELYPDEKEQERVGPAIGGQEGLAKLYNALIVKTKDALKGAIDAALPVQDASGVGTLRADFEREKRKRKADVARLTRECRSAWRSISEAKQIGGLLSKASKKNLFFFERLLHNDKSSELLNLFLRSQDSLAMRDLLQFSTKELDCQLGYNKLFSAFAALVPQNQRFFDWKDTSGGGIPQTRSKPDLILFERAVAKPHIASVMELKWQFSKESAYDEAVGQCSDRTTELDKSQPRRQKWIHAIGDKNEVEFWKMSLESDDGYVSSGRLPLFDSSGNLNANGYALRFLAGMFLADPKTLFYHPVDIPPPVRLQDGRFVEFLHLLDSFQTLGDSEEEEKRSAVQIYKGRVGAQEMIVKLPGNSNCEKEAAVLEHMAAISELKHRIVELEDVIVVREVEKGLLLKPAGSLIDLDRITPAKCLVYVQQLATTVMILAKHGYLHGDISYRNVIVHGNSIQLIDFRTCRRPEEDKEFTRTGTNAFMALETIISNKQDVRTVLESCLMLLLYLLLQGSSPWAVGTLDVIANKARRRGVFESRSGWAEIVKRIVDEEIARKATALKELFYPRGQYDIQGVSCETFLACIT